MGHETRPSFFSPRYPGSVNSLPCGEPEYPRSASNGVLKIDFEVIAQIFAAFGTAASAPARAAPNRSPKPNRSPRIIAEVGEGIGIEARIPSKPCSPDGHNGHRRALLRIAEDAVSLGGLFELLLGVLFEFRSG